MSVDFISSSTDSNSDHALINQELGWREMRKQPGGHSSPKAPAPDTDSPQAPAPAPYMPGGGGGSAAGGGAGICGSSYACVFFFPGIATTGCGGYKNN